MTPGVRSFSFAVIFFNHALSKKPVPMSHLPERTCLACGRKTNKTNLLRLTCEASGVITIDPHQRLPGRGAYVCRTPACGELLKKKKGLHHGFRRPVPMEIYDTIIGFLRTHAPQ
jgi:hypothetical protein